MSQIKQDVYEHLLKDKNEILKEMMPGARIFLSFEQMYAEDAEHFDAALKECILDMLCHLAIKNLNLNYEQVASIIDTSLLDDPNFNFYFDKETYLGKQNKD